MAATSEQASGWLGVVKALDRFWFTPCDPTPLACIRIVAALVVFYVHLCYSWDLMGYVGPDGWIERDLSLYIRNDIEIHRYGLKWNDSPEKISNGNYFWSTYFDVTDPTCIWLIHCGFLIAMLLFALGLWTPYTGFLSWVGLMMYVQKATITLYGLDTMMSIVLLYLQFGPSGAVYSLDRWLAVRAARLKGKLPPPVEPSVAANFALRMIQFHFAFIYFASGTSKLLGSSWWSGTSLNYVLLNAAFAPLHWGPYYRLLSTLASERWIWEILMSATIVGTLLLELCFIFLVWDRRWTWLLVSGATCLHLGIGLIMGLTTFSMMMFAMLISFIPPETLKAMIEEIGSRWLRAGSVPKPA
jgi:hypothetical protein